MKFTLGLFAVLAVIGLGQAHQFPDFGKGPLHEDLQDILDLIPIEKIANIVVDYVIYDKEVQNFLEQLESTNAVNNFLVGLQAIPEVTKLLKYLKKEGINVYDVMNTINSRALNIKELVPQSPHAYRGSKRTGGLAGFFKDIKKHIDYDVFINIYVDKLKTSTVFVNFINQLKSDNFQQIVNKVCKIEAFQSIINRLDVKSVNLKTVGNIMYLVLGINVPSLPSKTLMEELLDFAKVLPVEKILDIIIKYINEDEKVQNALLFMFTTEFHDLLRALEALKEHQALVIYLEKLGLPIIESIQAMHHAIGMEKYVPPKIESYLKSLIKTQKIGDGMKGMFKDIYDILPLDKIEALYKEKIETSKVYVNFIAKLSSKEMKKMINDLIAHKTYKEFITKTKAKGLDFEAAAVLNSILIGLK